MERDPITCHVLNTLTGKPASGLACTLILHSPRPSLEDASTFSFDATTDTDGRVKIWSQTSSYESSLTVPDILRHLPSPQTKSTWSIRFDVGPWYEAQYVESFWPEVEVKFVVHGRGEVEEGWRHHHVPVLLGPWSYTTYRGS